MASFFFCYCIIFSVCSLEIENSVPLLIEKVTLEEDIMKKINLLAVLLVLLGGMNHTLNAAHDMGHSHSEEEDIASSSLSEQIQHIAGNLASSRTASERAMSRLSASGIGSIATELFWMGQVAQLAGQHEVNTDLNNFMAEVALAAVAIHNQGEEGRANSNVPALERQLEAFRIRVDTMVTRLQNESVTEERTGNATFEDSEATENQ